MNSAFGIIAKFALNLSSSVYGDEEVGPDLTNQCAKFL